MQLTADHFLYWGVALLPFVGGAIAWILFDLAELASIRIRQRDRKAAIRAKNADLARPTEWTSTSNGKSTKRRDSGWDQAYRLTEGDFEALEETECTPRRCNCVLDQSPMEGGE